MSTYLVFLQGTPVFNIFSPLGLDKDKLKRVELPELSLERIQSKKAGVFGINRCNTIKIPEQIVINA